MFAIKKWRQYLLGREFVIRTDHKPLKYLLEQRSYIEAQHTWLLKLHSYKFVVEYKKGRENVVADTLSRRDEIDVDVLLMVTAVESDGVKQVKTMVQTDGYFQELNTKWETSILDPRVYQKKNGLFYYRNRILINPTSPSLTDIRTS